MLRGGALPHIGAGDGHAGPVENLRQRGHGNAADADQMGPPAGTQKIMDVSCSHGFTHPFQKFIMTIWYRICALGAEGKQIWNILLYTAV